MKKLIALLLAVLFVMGLCACNNSSSSESKLKKVESQIIPETIEGYQHSSSLAIVFSQTGTTLEKASYISQLLRCDMVELQAETPYTGADIDYTADTCRAKQEAEDESSRPAIKNQITKFDEYDTVYIGFPIWYDNAPKIIYTLFDSYDFTGKTVYLFCTSASSSMKSAYNNLKTTYPNINIANGKRFKQEATKDDMKAWLESLGTLTE